MADTHINENALPSKVPVSTSDFVRLVGSDNASYKALVEDVAKCIVEDYAGTSLGGSTQSIKNAIDSLRADDAGFHNSIFRGKDITEYLTNGSLWDRIKGTNGYRLFEDLYLGDYIETDDNLYYIMDFDYYDRSGPTSLTQHHLVMMPGLNMTIPAGTPLYGSNDTLTLITSENAGVTVRYPETEKLFKWNATMANPNSGTPDGGYKYSRMRTVIMKAADTIIVNIFGATHVKAIPVRYPNPSSATDSGLASSWAWFQDDDWLSLTRKSICDLPNETQITGQQLWGVGSEYDKAAYEVGIDKFQFATCSKSRRYMQNRGTYWLRNVTTSNRATFFNSSGELGGYDPSVALGVRPRFVLVG